MLTIRKATTADCELIHKLAWQIFPETYKDMYISLGTRTMKCVVMYLCNNKVKTYFIYRKYMYSPPFKAHIAAASYSMKPSNISRKYIPADA